MVYGKLATLANNKKFNIDMQIKASTEALKTHVALWDALVYCKCDKSSFQVYICGYTKTNCVACIWQHEASMWLAKIMLSYWSKDLFGPKEFTFKYGSKK